MVVILGKKEVISGIITAQRKGGKFCLIHPKLADLFCFLLMFMWNEYDELMNRQNCGKNLFL